MATPPNPTPPDLTAGEPSPKPKVKIIDSIPAFLFAVAAMGPFALPLLWRNPRFKRSTKVWASVAVLVFTYVLVAGFGSLMKDQWDQAQELMKQMQELQTQ